MKVLGIVAGGPPGNEPQFETSFIAGYESEGASWLGTFTRIDTPAQSETTILNTQLNYAFQNGYEIICTNFGIDWNSAANKAIYQNYYDEVGILCGSGSNNYRTGVMLKDISHPVGSIGAGELENAAGFYCELFSEDPFSNESVIETFQQSNEKIFIKANPANFFSTNLPVSISGITGFTNNPNGVHKITGFVSDGNYNKFSIAYSPGAGTYINDGTAQLHFESYTAPYVAGIFAYVMDTLNCSFDEARRRIRYTATLSGIYSGFGKPNTPAAIALDLDAVKNLTPGAITFVRNGLTVTLTLGRINQAESYEIELDGEIIATLDGGVTGLLYNYVLTSKRLKNNPYKFRYRGIDIDNNAGEWSEFVTIPYNYFIEILMVTPVIPSAPVVVNPVNGSSNNSITPLLTWTQTQRARTYNLQLSLSPLFASMVLNLSGIVNTFFQTTTSLTNDTVYYWRVAAVNTSGTSPYSNVFTFRTILAVPILTSPANAATGISITPLIDWQSVTGAVSYTYQLATDAGFTTGLQTITGITLSEYQQESLDPNIQYFWRVKSVNSFGASNYSASRSFTTIAVPAAPTLTAPLNNSTTEDINSMLFIWDAVYNATSYNLQVSTNSGFTNIIINQTGIASTLFDPTGLLNTSTHYWWRVSGTNALGTGAYSTIFNFTTLA